MHPPDKKNRLKLTCKCGAATLEGDKNFVRRIADRTDVRFRCHHCKTRVVWYDGEPARFAPESEVGP